MIDLHLDSLQETAEWLSVLAAYRTEQAVRKQTDPEHEGWIDRLTSVADLDGEQLSSIHGRLIAFGMLKFQLTSRTTGVQYQVSTAGVQALEKGANRTTTVSDDDDDDDVETDRNAA